MSTENTLKNILISTLGLKISPAQIKPDDGLLGTVPEFDSLAVVTVIEAIEDQFYIVIDDDEVDAEIFETFGSLLAFVEGKVD